jgi:peptidoglycan hydrolase-like protein with peptidoglycan-binding domain
VGSAGADVRELNDNLAALGYADAGSLAPAGTYTMATAAAIARWQAVLGVPATGLFSAGDAIVAVGAIRVTSVAPVTGQMVAPGQIVLTATETSRRVLVNLDVTEQTYAHRGEHVQVELPAGGTVGGTITSVGTVATSATAGDSNGTAGQAGGSSSGTQTIPVGIALDAGPAALGGLDQAPVTVDLIAETRHDVLSVPIDALQAEPDGIFAITTVDSRSYPHLVPVRTGLFTSGRVEISGTGITAGTRVEVASL